MDFLSIIQLPENVKDTIKYLQELLDEKGLYDNSLDFQIMNVSIQIVQLNKIITEFLSSSAIMTNAVRGQQEPSFRKNPVLADSINLSNSIRQNLKALGLTLSEKANPMGKSNPLGNLINKLNDIDNEDEDEDDADIENEIDKEEEDSE